MSEPKTILLVEDEELFRGMLADLLRFDDYNVIEACGGDEAIAAADSHSGQIDIVITDINLQGMTGVELVERLAQKHPRLAVIYMSGDTLAGAVGDAKVHPGAAFLQKPFESTALLDKVRELLSAA
ncbi:MAG: sensor hybrid histidine kinase [Verrucomicrobiales bacterium]|nr:sensor hybrid histidine kinase [Verrucomicrobiales bacterium]